MREEAEAARQLREQRADPVIKLFDKRVTPIVGVSGTDASPTDVVLTLCFRTRAIARLTI
jgi:hypothetical protein